MADNSQSSGSRGTGSRVQPGDRTGLWRVLLACSVALACSAYFLIQLSTSHSEVGPPTSTINKKQSYTHAYRQSD